MDVCHLKDTSCKLGTQAPIYEGKESVLERRTGEKKQNRESYYHHKVSVAYCIPKTNRTPDLNGN